MDRAKAVSFRLSDRHIHIIGIDPIKGTLDTSPDYRMDDVYSVLVRICKVDYHPPGDSGLSGSLRYDAIVLTSPASCPYGKDDMLVIYGTPDGTTSWASVGGLANVVFLRDGDSFADFRESR